MIQKLFVPFGSDIVDRGGTKILAPWQTFFRTIQQILSNGPQVIGTIGLTGQDAAVASATIGTTALTAGVYRVSEYLQITTAATVSSSVTVTIHWTNGGVSFSQAFPSVTGNTTSTFQSQPPLSVRIDGGTTINYSVAYTSSGATAAQYSLDLDVEALPG